MPKRLGVEETKKVLDKFYRECLSFWEREKEKGYDVDVKEFALKDVQNLEREPWSPKGALLDKDVVLKWVQDKN